MGVKEKKELGFYYTAESEKVHDGAELLRCLHLWGYAPREVGKNISGTLYFQSGVRTIRSISDEHLVDLGNKGYTLKEDIFDIQDLAALKHSIQEVIEKASKLID